MKRMTIEERREYGRVEYNVKIFDGLGAALRVRTYECISESSQGRINNLFCGRGYGTSVNLTDSGVEIDLWRAERTTA